MNTHIIKNAIKEAKERGCWGISIAPNGYTIQFHPTEENYILCTEIGYYNLIWYDQKAGDLEEGEEPFYTE